jgi:hypothetical protein
VDVGGVTPTSLAEFVVWARGVPETANEMSPEVVSLYDSESGSKYAILIPGIRIRPGWVGTTE